MKDIRSWIYESDSDYAVDHIFCRGHTPAVAWTVEVTDQFEAWWDRLDEDERVSIDGMIHVLEAHGPSLGAPYSIETAGSRYPQLRQLRVPHQGRDICVLYISDDWRSTLVLLTGGDAAPGEQFCSPEQVALADAIYGRYLAGGRGH